MTDPFQLILALLFSFGFNMIPFAGPSNLFIASNLALMLVNPDPGILIAIGFLVALGAALAKSVHYLVTVVVSKHLSAKQRLRLDAEALRGKKWTFLLLFAAAATPVPDEPIVIPLGLMKYSPVKFFSVYFFGKLCITVVGAFLGAWTGNTFSEVFGPQLTIALSIVLTVVITIIMRKVDVGKLAERILKRRKRSEESGATQTGAQLYD